MNKAMDFEGILVYVAYLLICYFFVKKVKFSAIKLMDYCAEVRGGHEVKS